MRALLIAFVGAIVILMATVGAVQTGYHAAALGEGVQTSNESFAITEGTTHTFNHSNVDENVFVATEDVTVTQNGTTVDSRDGANWRWNRNNGTLFVPTGSSLNESENANLEYSYSEASNEQELGRDVTLFAPETLGGAVGDVGGAALLIAAVFIMARMGGRA